MYRIYVEKKTGFQVEAQKVEQELKDFLGINGLKSCRFLIRYDIENLPLALSSKAIDEVFVTEQTDRVFINHIPLAEDAIVIAWEFHHGQYDQRALSAQEALNLLLVKHKATAQDDTKKAIIVKPAKMLVLQGDINASDIKKIESYFINEVDSQKANLDIPKTLSKAIPEPKTIPFYQDFIKLDEKGLLAFREEQGLAMDNADLVFVQDYFKKEGRDPSETEMRVLDTYWSDHCRHTTFNTILDDIEIEEGYFTDLFKKSFESYTTLRTEIHTTKEKPITLMDMATIGAKYLKKEGKLDDLEESEEINACSVFIDVHTENAETKEKQTEKWLLMFKNETHNHPTEIEPFGGANTCVGGGIRDPLSGRSWVYQGMRITGSANPRRKLERTRDGKLPQRKITKDATAGFSTYSNQIGLNASQAVEIYHPGYEAKRMELGALIAAAPAEQVKRGIPQAGDLVVLLGAKTGRDGIGGATSSSRVQTAESVETASAEVQKGDPLEERKILRLFRNAQVSSIIKRCNDFGAGGVSVAVGELAPGLHINLDAVPTKYDGLNGTELAISESQERMAVVIDAKDLDFLLEEAEKENLKGTVIAKVTDTNRLVMQWKEETIVDLDRTFLDTAGAKRHAKAKIAEPNRIYSPLARPLDAVQLVLNDESRGRCKKETLKDAWLTNMSSLACCSQQGMAEQFDASIGANSLLFPMGGKTQSTPEVASVAKIPVLSPKETSTTSIMAYGFDPLVAQWSPWHGAQVAVLESLAKIVSVGGSLETTRLSFQEYFERTDSPETWGKPTAALLGALDAQKTMEIPSIGGKDSMSGNFDDLKVPPALISFAFSSSDEENLISGAFKQGDSYVYAAIQAYTEMLAPDFDAFKENYAHIKNALKEENILSMYPVGAGGISEAISKMSFGNEIGCTIENGVQELLFVPMYGTIIVETREKIDTSKIRWLYIGRTQEKPVLNLGLHCYDGGKKNKTKETEIQNIEISIKELKEAWKKPLSTVFPVESTEKIQKIPGFAKKRHSSLKKHDRALKNKNFYHIKEKKPLVLLPVFPGTNGEYDMERAFTLAGAKTKTLVFRNKTEESTIESFEALKKAILEAEILAFSGGFSLAGEPDGLGKYTASILQYPLIKDAIMQFLSKDRLILGVGDGFHALLRSGLIPFGKVQENTTGPILVANRIGKHISRMLDTKIISAISPWAPKESLKDSIYRLPFSSTDGRLVLSKEVAKQLFKNGQVFSQYVDADGIIAKTGIQNPSASFYAIEGLTDPSGKILGKMAHNERSISFKEIKNATELFKNIPGNKNQDIFSAGVSFFN